MLCGIDLGGTKIEAAFVNPAEPDRAVARVRVATGSENGYNHILGQIRQCCELLEREADAPLPEVIGMGHPGTLDPATGVLKGSNTQCLNGRALREDLGRMMGKRLVLANDANCFALAEAMLGCARGFESVFGIILGTGVGGGLVVNGRVLQGCHGIAGEWGQIVLDPDGPVSPYGTRGTIEAHLAGPALENFYAERSGWKLALREIAAAAGTGTDRHAEETIHRLTSLFAKSIAIIIDVFDPHAIVIGGGVGNIGALYAEQTREAIRGHIFNATFDAALLKPVLGDSAGVFGAAMLTAP